MSGIIHKRKRKGVDFCGTEHWCYIIRSDLGCYMRSRDFHKGSNLSIHDLHPSCQHGEHYFADDEQFYIIKGDDCHTVTDLSADTESSVFTLHPKWRGGDHYLSAFGWFFIIFQKKGTYRRTEDLSENYGSEEFPLHPNCRDGLYYWGLPDHLYFLKPNSELGVRYYKGTSLKTYKRTGVYSVHPDVLNFLPGGLSITNGPAFGMWMSIKTVSNYSLTPMTWQKKIIKKVGYNKEKVSEITQNWEIEASASVTSGKLPGFISNSKCSFTAKYGGSSVNAEQENWNEETVEEVSFELKPNERLYHWQYQLGLGSERVLVCKDLKITNKPEPPTEVP